MREAIEALPHELQERIKQQAREVNAKESQGKPVACPLLVDDRCAVYESRPLICRTQGLPLLIAADDGEQEVDFCPLNFTAPNAFDDLDADRLAPLDALNLKLAIVNLQYCQENGIEKEAVGERKKIGEIIFAGGCDENV